jgi:hypothetical protein
MKVKAKSIAAITRIGKLLFSSGREGTITDEVPLIMKHFTDTVP